MTVYTDFQHSIASARALVAMYRELRRGRGLGAKGKLNHENEDLLWLPRSAVVSAMSALDAYVHAVLDDRIPKVLQGQNVPESLCAVMSDILPIKNAATFRSALPTLNGGNIHATLAIRLRDVKLQYVSYQAPDKIIGAYEMIGHPAIFETVSGIWPGPNTTAADLARWLANYYKRRNQIAHEGDREVSGAVRHMQPVYAKECADFVENLVNRLNRIAYGQG